MIGKNNMLSKLLKIFLYGIINLVVVLALISVTKFNSQGVLQSQIIEILIIVFVTGLVNYIIVTKKFF